MHLRNAAKQKKLEEEITAIKDADEEYIQDVARTQRTAPPVTRHEVTSVLNHALTLF